MTGRKAVLVAAAASMALAAYGSLVPFRWREAPGTAWDRVSSLPLAPLAVTWSGDLVVNVAVMLPIGFFGMAAASGGRRVRRQTGILVVAALAAFALALEVAQLFVRDRTASWSDVAGLTFGGVAGVTLWMVAGERLIARGRRIRDGSLPARLRGLTLLYAAGWVAIGLLPLLFPRYAYPLVRSVWLRTAAPQTAWTTAAEWALDAVSVAPIGAAIILASLGAPLRAHAAAAMAVAVAAAVVGLDALEQVAPLVSRASPWARLLGLSLGAAAGARLARHGLSRTTAGLLFACWLALVGLVTWAPFDFGVSPELMDQRIRILYERAPLSRYYWAPPLVALDMAATLLILAIAGVILLAVAAAPRTPGGRALVALCVVSFFTVLEWGQLHLPARRADPTDVGLAVIGAFIGTLLSAWLSASPGPPRAGS